jgi:hypothetical protein
MCIFLVQTNPRALLRNKLCNSYNLQNYKICTSQYVIQIFTLYNSIYNYSEV